MEGDAMRRPCGPEIRRGMGVEVVSLRRGEALPRPSFGRRCWGWRGTQCVAPADLKSGEAWVLRSSLSVGARHCLAPLSAGAAGDGGRRNASPPYGPEIRRGMGVEVVSLRRGEALPRPSFGRRCWGWRATQCVAPTDLKSGEAWVLRSSLSVGARHCLAPLSAGAAGDGG